MMNDDIRNEVLVSKPNSYSITFIMDMLFSQGIRISEETCRRYLKESGINHNDWSTDWYWITPNQDIDKLIARVAINKLRDTF
jgi:hypothetical protein